MSDGSFEVATLFLTLDETWGCRDFDGDRGGEEGCKGEERMRERYQTSSGSESFEKWKAGSDTSTSLNT